jgi:ATP-dependent Clp protease ATP-binding subunit ClpC
MAPALPPDGHVGAERFARALATLGESARAVIREAHDEAYSYASNFVGSAHLLLGLVADVSHRITAGLDERGVSPAVIRGCIEEITGVRQRPSPRFVHLPFSPQARALVVTAALLAEQAGAAATEPDHLWLAITRNHGLMARQVLTELGQLDYVRELAGQSPPVPGASASPSA